MEGAKDEMKQNDCFLKEGYKKTSIGVIPEDWEITQINQIGKVSSGSTPLRSNLDYFEDGLIPWFRTTDLNNSIIFESSENITEKALIENNLKSYPKGTIVVAMYGGFNQIGRTGLLGIGGTINQALSAIIVNDRKADSLFLLYWLNFYVGIWKRYAASSRKDPNITGSDVKSFPFASINLPEQKAIADCLSTWDRAIEKQSRLIEAKKEFKKGLMQGFFGGSLTVRDGHIIKAKEGEDFTEDWEEVRLGDTLNYEQPTKYLENNFDASFHESKVPVLTANQTFVLGYTLSNKGIYKNLPVIIFDDFTTASRYVDFPFKVKSSAIKFLKTRESFNLKFMFELLQTLKIDVSSHKRRWISEFSVKKIKIPKFELQCSFAQVIQSADQEIKLQEQKLEQLKMQKKGLMQVLLTGEKRLV